MERKGVYQGAARRGTGCTRGQQGEERGVPGGSTERNGVYQGAAG